MFFISLPYIQPIFVFYWILFIELILDFSFFIQGEAEFLLDEGEGGILHVEVVDIVLRLSFPGGCLEEIFGGAVDDVDPVDIISFFSELCGYLIELAWLMFLVILVADLIEESASVFVLSLEDCDGLVFVFEGGDKIEAFFFVLYQDASLIDVSLQDIDGLA